MKLKPLTNKQILNLTRGKKHWSEKTHFLLNYIKILGHEIWDNELKYFMETYVPAEKNRLNIEHAKKVATGELKTSKTPTDIKGDFLKVEDPVIGEKYHVSWAYSGAVFVLKDMNATYAWLDNPKRKRAKLMRVNRSELRHLRSRDFKTK